MNRPTALKSHGYAGMRKADLISPLSDCHRLTVVRKSSVVRSVIGLFFIRSPATVFFKVPFGTVYSVNGAPSRARSKVFVKGFKRVAPPIADSDISASINTKGFARAVITASEHILPRFALAVEIGAAMRVATRLCSFFSLLLRHATARLCATALKFWSRNNFYASAIASAQPSGVSFCGVFDSTDCRQSPEFFAFQTFAFRHDKPCNPFLNIISHKQ